MPSQRTHSALAGLQGLAEGLIEGFKLRKQLDLQEQKAAESRAFREESQKLARERFEFEKSKETNLRGLKREKDLQREEDKVAQFNASVLGKITHMEKTKSSIQKRITEIETGMQEANRFEESNIALKNRNPQDAEKREGLFETAQELINRGQINDLPKVTTRLKELGLNEEEAVRRYEGMKQIARERRSLAEVDENIGQFRNMMTDRARRLAALKGQQTAVPMEVAQEWENDINTGVVTGDPEKIRNAWQSVKNNRIALGEDGFQAYMAQFQAAINEAEGRRVGVASAEVQGQKLKQEAKEEASALALAKELEGVKSQ